MYYKQGQESTSRRMGVPVNLPITDIEDLWLILGPGEMLEVDDMSDEAVLRAANEYAYRCIGWIS